MTYEIRKLHEVFTIKKGKKPDLHAVKKPGDVPYLVAKVMRGAQDPEWARRDDPNAVHVTEGEAIIICDGSNSGEVFSGFSGALSSTMAKIEPKVPIDQIYLRRFLESNAELFAGTKTGAAIPHLDQDAMFNLEIPLPPIPEQQRIVRLLDEVFEGISIAKANAEKNLQNARALFESRLQSVFAKGGDGWETKKLSEIATHSLGKMLDKAKNKGEFQPYLRNLNVRWAEFDLSDVLEMRFLASEAERYTVLKGDVLVCEGGYPGRAAIWTDDEPIYFQKALHRVRFHEIGRNRWFIYYLIAKDADGTLKSHFNGTGIQHFTGEALARFEVPLPPLREQDELLDRLDDLHEMSLELSKAYSAKVSALDDLKDALLSVAFSGNLKAA